MTSPILLATTSDGQRWSDPSEDLLFMLFEDMAAGDVEFFIVERLSDPSGQTFCQVVLCAKTDPAVACNCFRNHGEPWWLVERREGSADRHLAAGIADLRAAHQQVTSWAHPEPHPSEGAAQVDWTPLRFD